ncbi:MAG: cell division protein SepF [Acidaminobacteraceae bacterium]
MAEKFMDKVKFFMGLGPYEEEDEYGEEDLEDTDNTYSQPTASTLYPSSKDVKSHTNTTTQTPSPNKIVNFNKPQPSTNMKVICIEPKTFDDSRSIVDHLKAQKPVILNIEPIDRELARKIFDFCSGALYALDGHIQQVSRGIFVLAPKNIDVSGDVKTELQNKGIFNFNTTTRE